jgi:hypothetical protein
MLRANLRHALLVMCTILLLAAGRVEATIIVAYRSDSHIAIAADSLATSEVRRGSTNLHVCKIDEHAGAIFAMAGVHSSVFDPRTIVREALTGRTSIRETAVALAGRLPAFYQSWLAQYRPHDLDRIRPDANRPIMLSSLVLGAYESAGPAAALLDFYMPPGPGPSVDARLRWICDAAGCDHPFAPLGTYPVLARRMNAFRPALPPEAIRATAAESAAALVQLEIDAGTPAVGAPIAVAQVSSAGVSWAVPGACNQSSYSRTPSGVMPQGGTFDPRSR